MHLVLQIFTLIGAMCLFLYGMTLMSEGLQKAAGDKMRQILASMTSTRFKGILTGIILTALIQSSSGTTVMVVSMVNAGLLALGNAIGVVMGSHIGTTVTAWLVAIFGFSYDIASFAIPLIAFGLLTTILKRGRYKNIGEFIIGFALLLIGLVTMKNSVPDLNQYPETLALVKNLTSYGFGSIIIFTLIGALITVILQASSAAMALTMVFVANGWINFEMAAAMVLGENIGTTITANLAAAVANYSAKRTALAHTVINCIGVVFALILFNPLMKVIGYLVTLIGLPDPVTTFHNMNIGGDLNIHLQHSMLYGICFLHTVFNTATTLILVWFIPLIETLVTKMVPTPQGKEEEFKLKYIQGGPLSTAELSLDEAKQEIIHLAEICYEDFNIACKAINTKDDNFEELRQQLIKYEDVTDKLEYTIASYLNEVSKGDLSERSASRIRVMYKVIGELESLGDSGEAIGRILNRMNTSNKSFDDSKLERINRMLNILNEAYKAMIDNLRSSYINLPNITKAKDIEYRLDDCRNVLREEHIVNMEENSNYNYQMGVFYMDIVSELEKMGDFIINISESQVATNT